MGSVSYHNSGFTEVANDKPADRIRKDDGLGQTVVCCWVAAGADGGNSDG